MASLESWYPSTIPSTVSATYVATGATLALWLSYSSAAAEIQTASEIGTIASLSQVIRGAQASLTLISAEQLAATATASSVQSYASSLAVNASLNLAELQDEQNPYNTDLKLIPNVIFLAIFAAVFTYNTGMMTVSRYWWYNIANFGGYGLEFAGFLGRVLANSNIIDKNYFLLQYVSLTISPAFIMAGVYFVFAQLVVMAGRPYSVLKPMWYSYFFVTTDVVSLVIQAIGGGMASVATDNGTDPDPGTHTMTAGIAFQVAAMSVFVSFWIEFLHRLYFKHSKDVPGNSFLKKCTPVSVFCFLFNTRSASEFKRTHLEQYYNPKYAHIRSRPLFDYMPLAVTVTVIAIYVRCIYRVVELCQGFDGYLITHEVYLMVLDAAMIAMAGLISIPFHPVVAFGRNNVVRLAHIRKNADEEDDEDEFNFQCEDPKLDWDKINETSETNEKTESSYNDTTEYNDTTYRDTSTRHIFDWDTSNDSANWKRIHL